VNRFEEILFPQRLHRLDYFVRILVADAILWLLLNSTSPSDPTLGGLRLAGIFLGLFVLGIYSLFFVLLPRTRDVGWNSWLVIIGLFPYIGLLLHLVLLFVPPKRDVANETV
jgi:uncharacterized membrane protein YhaH (DUF805 family)